MYMVYCYAVCGTTEQLSTKSGKKIKPQYLDLSETVIVIKLNLI